MHDGIPDLRSAKHLLGKDTWEVEDIIKEELGYKKRNISVFSIGPAGENLVAFAGFHGDRGYTATHNGIGAVMGSKKLKAIAISRNQGYINIANRIKLNECKKELLEYFKIHNNENYNYGTHRVLVALDKVGMLPERNFTTNIFLDANKFNIRDRFKILQDSPCIFCPSRHCIDIKVTEGPYAGFFGKDPQYE